MANDITNYTNNVNTFEPLIRENEAYQVYDFSGFTKNASPVTSDPDSSSFTNEPTPLQGFTSIIKGKNS